MVWTCKLHFSKLGTAAPMAGSSLVICMHFADNLFDSAWDPSSLSSHGGLMSQAKG